MVKSPSTQFDRKYQMIPIPLKNWSITAEPTSAYSQPQQCLRGQRFEESNYVRTSEIKVIVGDLVITASGTVYQLKTPHPDYLKACQDNGWHIPTKKEPIRLR